MSRSLQCISLYEKENLRSDNNSFAALCVVLSRQAEAHDTILDCVILYGSDDLASQFEHQTSLSTPRQIFIKQD